MKNARDSIEEIYKNAFENAKNLTSDEISKGVVEKMKKRPAIKKTTLIIFAACFLLFSTVAVGAISHTRGSFEWLTARLGGEAAERLQPIGLGLTYVRADDIFATENIEADGVRIELIAVGAGDYELDIYILLEDLTESRVWGEEIMVGHTLRFTDTALLGDNPLENQGHSGEFNVIERDDDARIAVFHSRMTHPILPHDADTSDANTRDLTLFVAAILFSSAIYENPEAGISFADMTELPQSPVRILTYEETSILGATGHHRQFEAGEFLLAPNSLNIPFELERHPLNVSAIAVIDNKLHLQFSGDGNTFALPSLRCPDGEILEEYFAHAFRLDERGNFQSLRTWDNGNWLWNGDVTHWEYVFDINPDRLDRYELTFGALLVQDELILNRAVSFELARDVGIPRGQTEQERFEEFEATMAEIFGDSPRNVWIYHENGDIAGILSANMTITSDRRTGEISRLEVRPTFMCFDTHAGETYMHIRDGICVIRQAELLPPELRGEIMYHAEKWLALQF
ncbi:MAG: hypothetical protein FWC70_11985 [Defluviitaleaceae bacterium]|nr:hypothetical protein [Defluviitaleaceae bacterium]